jgi:hypothetical protein
MRSTHKCRHAFLNVLCKQAYDTDGVEKGKHLLRLGLDVFDWSGQSSLSTLNTELEVSCIGLLIFLAVRICAFLGLIQNAQHRA